MGAGASFPLSRDRPDGIHKTIRYPQKPEDLVARGWGAIGRRENQPVEGRSGWKDGVWTVVLARKLSTPGGVAFKSGTVLPIAVAVWDGSSKERGPAKSFSVWNNLLYLMSLMPKGDGTEF